MARQAIRGGHSQRYNQENLKQGLPTNLIVVKDEKGRERILVPRCQRERLVTTEHETMLHVEGARVHYELARKYIWPNMVREIKITCKACQALWKSQSSQTKIVRRV
jgi:hypothetical protein